MRLAGWGETADAHHISAPEPQGIGAIEAIRLALARAGLSPAQIDYVNLHGTATPQNDAMEAGAVQRTLGVDVPCSSTKPLTGHALGAAGASAELGARATGLGQTTPCPRPLPAQATTMQPSGPIRPTHPL